MAESSAAEMSPNFNLVLRELAGQASVDILHEVMDVLVQRIPTSTISTGLLKYMSKCDDELDTDGLVIIGDGDSEKAYEKHVCKEVRRILLGSTVDSPAEQYLYDLVREMMSERIKHMQKVDLEDL